MAADNDEQDIGKMPLEPPHAGLAVEKIDKPHEEG